MDVSFCLLCMYNMCVYISIHKLSTVGTGVLMCSLLCYICYIEFLKRDLFIYFNFRNIFGGKHSREWPAGKTESEIKLLIQENLYGSPTRFLTQADCVLSSGLAEATLQC